MDNRVEFYTILDLTKIENQQNRVEFYTILPKSTYMLTGRNYVMETDMDNLFMVASS